MKNKRAKALMVLGTASHVGKSITATALCRIFRRDGLSVAPFKAQNMALNSFATREGHEIGRAQAVQAQAAGLEPHVDMNPILLKPSSVGGSQVVLNGEFFGNVTAATYRALKPRFFAAVAEAYNRLASRRDVIILEGAGSPVEVNLKDDDIVNLKMAEVADAVCILIADIDRGGVFASLVGTYELLTPGERARFGGFVINKFRGDVDLLRAGVDFLQERLKQPCLGIVPYVPDLGIDQEDGVALDDLTSREAAGGARMARLRVCVVRLPHISNFTDFAPLEAEPDVALFYARTPVDSGGVDVIVLPGSKNVISDLNWLRTSGWAQVVTRHARADKPVIGVCGGFQMLGREVFDPFRVEGDADRAAGLGLLDVVTSLGCEKVTRQARARLLRPEAIGATEPQPIFEGYEIHLGETRLGPRATPFFRLTRLGDEASISDGAMSGDGRVIGTYLHGLFDSTEGRAALLGHWRRACGRVQDAPTPGAALDRERRYDRLAAHFRRHLDIETIYQLVGAARDRPQRHQRFGAEGEWKREI